MIRQLTVKNLRNLNIQEKRIQPGYNIIVGDNGQGKTNFLESLYILAYGKSFRDEKSKIINWEENEARVAGKTDRDTLEVVIRRDRDNAVLINSKAKTASALLGRFVCVVFHPKEIDIVSGPPSLRRAWLDRLIATIDKKYLQDLIEYNRSMQNRNKLLKGPSEDSQIEVWDKNLALLGTRVWSKRRETLDKVNQILRKESVKLTQKEVLLDYEHPLTRVEEKVKEKRYLGELLSRRTTDRKLFVTTFGPHRDDFKIIFEQKERHNILQKEVSYFGSRAEHRQSILLLKIAEARIFSEHFEESPTILLDDVASELDEKNRELLTSLQAKQVFITTTTLDLLPKQILAKAKIFRMVDGDLQSA